MPTVEPASTPPDGAPRAWTVPAVPWERLPLLFHVARLPLAVGTVVDLTVPAPDDGRGSPEALAALLAGAGFTPVDSPRTTGDGTLRARAVRDWTLADTVGPGMRVLICGVNPSPYSADAGVGYARPGNRFWPAALAAGLVEADRDPVAALARGVGMTDFAKRPTSTAAEVRPDEYAAGFARVTGIVEWLRPRVVCFVGLSGWRTVVDRRATAGFQPATVGGRPAYVMPSTSGLNARTPLDELARHLAAAAGPAPAQGRSGSGR